MFERNPVMLARYLERGGPFDFRKYEPADFHQNGPYLLKDMQEIQHGYYWGEVDSNNRPHGRGVLLYTHDLHPFFECIREGYWKHGNGHNGFRNITDKGDYVEGRWGPGLEEFGTDHSIA